MRKLVGWGAATLVAIAVAVGVLGMRYGWHWGDVPTWVGAMATVCALMAAGVGAYFAYRQLSALREQVRLQVDALELQRDQQRADREESDRQAKQELKFLKVEARRQAEKVDVIPKLEAVVTEDEDGTIETYKSVLALRVINGSPRPIRHVSCLLLLKPYSYAPYGHLNKSEQSSEAVPIYSEPMAPVKFVRRGDSMTFVFPVQRQHREGVPGIAYILWSRESDGSLADNFLPGEEMLSPKPEYTIRFTDDADQHWELTDELRLTQINDRSDW